MKKSLLFAAFFCLALVFFAFSASAADAPMDFTSSASDASGQNWFWDASEKELQLRSFTLEVDSGDAIRLPAGSRVYFAGLCSVKSADGSAFSSSGLFTVNGAGKLDIVGTHYGIDADDVVLFAENINVEGRLAAVSGYVEADAGRGITVSNGADFVEEEYNGHRFVRSGLLYPVYVTVTRGGGASILTGMFAPGQTVVITARPQYGYDLLTWKSSFVELEGAEEETVRFIMPEKAVRLYGEFERVYSVTVPEVEGGTVEFVSAKRAFAPGKQVILYAKPDTGYYFSHWETDYGRFRDPLQAYAALNMPAANVVATPVFVKGESYYLKVEIIGEGETNITLGNFSENKSILLRATPAEGYMFSGWMSEGGHFLSSAAAQTYFTMPPENTVITAVFSLLDEFKKTLTVEGLIGGTVNVTGGLYAPGMPITLRAEPKTGYEFIGWSITPEKFRGAFVDGNYAETDFLMPPEDVTISAQFALVDPEAPTFYLSVGTTDGGSVVSVGSGEYLAGYEIDLAATPDEGYYFAGWKSAVGGKFENDVDQNTIFYMPANDTRVTAVFNRILDPIAPKPENSAPVDGADLDSGISQEYLSFGLSLVLCALLAAGGTLYAEVSRKASGIAPRRRISRKKYDLGKMHPKQKL